MRIRTRLLVVVFGVWLSAAAGFGLLTWNLHQQKALADLQQVKNFADGINTVVARELDKRVLLARTLAASRAAREGDFARFHDEARIATRGTDSWALLVEPEWVSVNTLQPFSTERIPRLKPQPLATSGPSVIFVPKGSVSHKPVVTVMVPIPEVATQKFNVGISFPQTSFQRLLNDDGSMLATLTTVVDAQQLIMARTRDPELWIGRSASPGFKRRILEGGVGFAESTTLDGVPSLTYLTAPNAYGWSVVVAIPQAQLTAAAWQASAKAMGASGVLLLLLLACALYGARSISRAVQALAGAAADLGANRLSERLQSGVQEFDEVAAALHAAGIQALEAKSTLERRVEVAVHEAEEAQAKLLQGQKLELIGRLTAGVAHDFNNLLQTITTAHHVLGRRTEGEKEQRVLSAAVRATSKAADLVKQMMMLGRVQKLEPELVNIADAVLKGHELTSKAVGAGVVLSASLDPNLPPVFVDAAQFDMALLNLVFNARDAMPGGGRITIAARVATAQESAALGRAAYVRLDVSDDGKGMSSETAARAFEPFFTTKPVGAGTGLGLAQVHAFARQSGGDIDLASEPGKGTRVTLFLPVATPAQGQSAALEDRAAPPAPPGPGLSVLMVEDDALVASVVSSALVNAGYRVRVCGSADEAVAVLAGGEGFDVLFTDVVMPGTMNGIDLVSWAQVHRAHMAAVVATGYADNVSELTVPVLRKPYDIETLQQALGRARAAVPGLSGDHG